jgi:archaellin
MKKSVYLLIAALTLICACHPEDKDPKGPSIVNPGDIIVNGKETLEPDQQKQKLEQVATKVLNLLPASEFEDVMDICAKALGDGESTFEEGYDISELEGVWEDMEEDFFSYQEISDTEVRIFLYLFFSNCTGVVEFGEHKATYKKSSETKVIYYEEDGTKWEVEITPKKLKEVYLGEWLDSYYDYEDVWYKEYYNVTVEVPGSLSASIKRNGKTFAAASFSIDHNFGKDGIDLEKDHITLSCELQFDDLKFNVSKAMYNAKSGDIEFSASIYKGDIFVCSVRFSGNGTYDLAEDGDLLDWDAEGFEFSTNLLGEIQIKGNCTDAVKLAEYADSYFESESELERVVNNINSIIEINVYYDGTSAKQAAIEMEPMVEKDSYGYYYWIEPVIVFNDGSRYLFYEYFDEDDFSYLIQKFERMIENYASLARSFEGLLDQ